MGTFFFCMYILAITNMHFSTSKTKALILNAAACLFCAVYMFEIDAMGGLVACLAAGGGSLFQLYVYKTVGEQGYSRSTQIQKLIGCTLFATIGIVGLYEAPSDLILIFAIIACRGSEMLDNPKQMKLGYVLAEALWMIYAADKGIVGIYVVHLVMIAIGSYSIYVMTKEESQAKSAIRIS